MAVSSSDFTREDRLLMQDAITEAIEYRLQVVDTLRTEAKYALSGQAERIVPGSKRGYVRSELIRIKNWEALRKKLEQQLAQDAST